MLWILLLVVIGLALVYLFIVRPWLMTHPALAPAFAAEASFVEKIPGAHHRLEDQDRGAATRGRRHCRWPL
jgi:hypothetical protein